ncbi:hypothetical protein BDP27DRAFT_1367962 [Rhodocollybia butyracea]|uniref:Uncharacterized protein n=1 Tax=Rhodocollybia butyracea TaxID=206335 RepID=A0A9P5U399_9AGAR|nr:hypothetical protein BDP27DRAFT_1367962 [Rhodocollybia butyracea]
MHERLNIRNNQWHVNALTLPRTGQGRHPAKSPGEDGSSRHEVQSEGELQAGDLITTSFAARCISEARLMQESREGPEEKFQFGGVKGEGNDKSEGNEDYDEYSSKGECGWVGVGCWCENPCAVYLFGVSRDEEKPRLFRLLPNIRKTVQLRDVQDPSSSDSRRRKGMRAQIALEITSSAWAYRMHQFRIIKEENN